MRRLVALVLAALLVTACGNGGDKPASTVPPQPTLPAGDTLPPSGDTTPEAPPATTDVAPPDAIGRLAASFTAQLISRQKKDVGLGPLACRDLAGSAGCIQLLSGGGAFGSISQAVASASIASRRFADTSSGAGHVSLNCA